MAALIHELVAQKKKMGWETDSSMCWLSIPPAKRIWRRQQLWAPDDINVHPAVYEIYHWKNMKKLSAPKSSRNELSLLCTPTQQSTAHSVKKQWRVNLRRRLLNKYLIIMVSWLGRGSGEEELVLIIWIRGIYIYIYILIILSMIGIIKGEFSFFSLRWFYRRNALMSDSWLTDSIARFTIELSTNRSMDLIDSSSIQLR